MLNRLNINRFKTAREVSLEFGLVNLFIGGNGSGKSNILEAIGLLSSALYRGISDEELSRKGVRITPPALMKSAFKSQKLPKTFRIEAEMAFEVDYAVEISASEGSTHVGFHSEKGTLGGKPFLGRSQRGVKIAGNTVNRTWSPTRSLWDQARLAYDMPIAVEREFEELARFAIYSPQTEFLREVKSGLVADPPIGLHGEGLSTAVSTLLGDPLRRPARQRTEDERKTTEQINDAINLVWLPGWTSEVRVERISPELKSRDSSSLDGKSIYFIDEYMHEKRNTLSAYDSSEGTLFLLYMAVLLGHAEAPPIFAVDNVDSALNPAVTRKMIETIIKVAKRKREASIRRGPSQIFLTSHNPSSVDAFDLFDDDQRVFVVSRQKSGATKVSRVKPKPGMTKEEWSRLFKGRNLSQLWIEGELKGALGDSISDV